MSADFIPCVACNRLEAHLLRAMQAGDLVAIKVRTARLVDHQVTNCINRAYYTGAARVLERLPEAYTAADRANPEPIKVEVSTLRLEFVGIMPKTGQAVYVVNKERERA